MRLKSQYVFVIGVLGAVALFFLVGALIGGGHKPNRAVAKPVDTTGTLPSVQVKLVPEQLREYDVVLRGRTQATRAVTIRSETAGLVAQTPILQGTVAPKGTVLCRLAVDARQASLDQARAAFKSMQLQQQANTELAKKGYRSQTQLLQGQAGLDQAQAAVRVSEIALRQVEIRAPFTGIFDHRDAEVGTYLAPGQSCGSLIELNPLLIVGDVPETDAGKLHVGAIAAATLVDGERLSGRIRYVAHDADPATRTYRVEVTVPNPRLSVRAGLSADLRIAAGAGPAHLAPVSALVLDSAGRQGLRYVTADNRVAFAPVIVLEQTPEGAWVRGLNGPVRIITVGQSYVAEGQRVRVGSAL